MTHEPPDPDPQPQQPGGPSPGRPSPYGRPQYPPAQYPAPQYPPAPGQPPDGPPPGGYGQPPFGPPPLPAGMAYAPWGRRVLAYVIDVLLLFACFVPTILVVGVAGAVADSTGDDFPVAGIVALVVVMVGGLFVWLWQITWRQGKRGQSWGKQLMGLHLVRIPDLNPPGGGIGIARYAVNWALGNVSCGIYSLVNGFWPLGDQKKQSLDDKLLNTLVVQRIP